jgi:hypothetical protein
MLGLDGRRLGPCHPFLGVYEPVFPLMNRFVLFPMFMNRVNKG